MDNLSLQQKLETTLKKLPRGYLKIAEYLSAREVQGVPENPCACPIARWLRQELGVAHVTAAPLFVTAWPDGFGEPAQALTTDHVDTFILAFDQGRFPELVDQAGPTRDEQWWLEDGGYEPL